jgi:hypothetical protein
MTNEKNKLYKNECDQASCCVFVCISSIIAIPIYYMYHGIKYICKLIWNKIKLKTPIFISNPIPNPISNPNPNLTNSDIIINITNVKDKDQHTFDQMESSNNIIQKV